MKYLLHILLLAAVGQFYFPSVPALQHLTFNNNNWRAFYFSAHALPKFTENLEEFDQEFNILVETDAEKQVEAKRLKQVEAEVNEENKLFESGKASFGERLYPFSDWSKDDFESQKLGLVQPASRAMGLFLPPESERNTPENQAKLDSLYHQIETNRAYTPRTYSSQSMGKIFQNCIAVACYNILTFPKAM